jgi:hypothetical protein
VFLKLLSFNYPCPTFAKLLFLQFLRYVSSGAAHKWFFKLFPSTIVGGHKLEFYLQPIISRIPRRSAFALSIVDFLIVDIADSNQLPPRKPFGFMMNHNLSLLPPGVPPSVLLRFTPISFFELNYHQESSANKLDSFLERQLHHDCSHVQLLFCSSVINHIF